MRLRKQTVYGMLSEIVYFDRETVPQRNTFLPICSATNSTESCVELKSKSAKQVMSESFKDDVYVKD